MHVSLQEVYFKKHKFNTIPNVQMKNVDRYVLFLLFLYWPLCLLFISCSIFFFNIYSLNFHSLKKDAYEIEIQNLLR